MDFEGVVENVGKAMDLAGVAVILVGAIVATGVFLRRVVRRAEGESYRS